MSQSHALEERTLPHNLEAERAVLGAILTDESRLADVAAVLAEQDFYRDAHRRIYRQIRKLADADSAIDALTIRDALMNAGDLDECGGPAYLFSLTDGVPQGSHVEQYARIVHDKAELRRLIFTANKLLADAYSAEENAQDVLDRAEQALFSVHHGGATGGLQRLADFIPAAMDQIEAWCKTPGGVTGIPSGFRDLDAMTRGFHPGTLVIVAARPAMGKAQPLDAKVLDSHGIWRRMGDLQVGDELATPDGRPSRVMAVHERGTQQVYRLTFVDGRSTEACGDHLWKASSTRWSGGPKVLSTSRLIDKLATKRYESRLHVDLIDGAFGGRTEPLPIDPWVLGVLLGDGSFRKRTTFTTADPDLALRVAARVGHVQTTNEGGYSYRLSTKRGQPNPIQDGLRKLDLWNLGSHEKFIPDQYLRLCKPERTELLAGLLDTDGWVEKFGCVRFCTTSERLANDVVQLARSLGATCTLKPRKAKTYTNRTGARRPCKPSFICTISHQSPRDLFTLERKRVRVRTNRRRAQLAIRSIVASRKCETRCITVDHPDGLYVTDDFIVTHNSSLVLNIAQHVAASERVVAFFSLEMSHEELTLRSIAAEARIDGHRLQRGQVWQSEWGRLSQAFGALSELNLYLDESPFVTVFDIKARCRRLQAHQRLDLVIVDYTQLMVGHERHQNRTLEIAAITRGLKALSKDLHVPVIALSQLNRDLEKRDNKRPLLSDLRDSGALEQDADVVIFIYRDEVYHTDTQDVGVAELIIAKHRNGPIGTVKIGWRAEEMRFVNAATVDEPEERHLPLGDR